MPPMSQSPYRTASGTKSKPAPSVSHPHPLTLALALALALAPDPNSLEETAEQFQLSVPIILLVTAALGISSQTLISSMLNGDQGLSAFLSDGRGYGNSKFKARREGADDNGAGAGAGAPLGGDDPLPWLKLPQFSYVDVAGQEAQGQGVEREIVAERLEELAMRGKRELEVGEKEKAAETMREMKALMEEYGFE